MNADENDKKFNSKELQKYARDLTAEGAEIAEEVQNPGDFFNYLCVLALCG